MSTLINQAYPILESFSYTGTLNECKKNEDSARQGYNRALATINQLAQTYLCSIQINKLNYFSQKLVYPLILLSPFISLADYVCQNPQLNINIHPSYRKICHVLYEHIGSGCQVAFLITNIALFILGIKLMQSLPLQFLD